jgi:SWI/SNF-related matrix-associated actin-dependent regulator of chromatin subfamily A member 5
MNERERLRKTVLSDVTAFDVVLTTYEMVISKNMKHSLHSSIHWRYVVLDEAHKCKNEDSLVSKSVKAINTQQILLLTGAHRTPMGLGGDTEG